jgi:glycosyltransferase involved in cell wall biosynthesis
MKILIITQKVNMDDPVLGFFHRWIAELAKHFSSVTVICLEMGTYDLPPNVKVLSLGKEEKQSRLQYLARFYSYVFKELRNYDVIFSHMNQEYIILAGWFWKICFKRMYMWRNHHAGDELTDMAAAFCNKIFCTSKYSYTVKFKKTKIMPVGIDTEVFKPVGKMRPPRSILFLGRIAPVKRVDVFIDALKKLHEQRIPFQASIYGDASVRHHDYYAKMVNTVNEAGLAGQVSFHQGISNTETVSVYNSHDVFVNLSSSGMYDKTIFEAMASGAVTLSSNENLRGQIDDRLVVKEDSAEALVEKIKVIFALPESEKNKLREKGRQYTIEKHSLPLLATRLVQEMSSRS